jgi:hypothetical protein
MPLASLRPTARVVLRFGFGHHVIDPHYHHEGTVTFEFAGPVVTDPDAPNYAMGADAAAVARSLDALIREHLAGRMLFNGACPPPTSFTVADKGFVLPRLAVTECALPPTIEVVTCILARMGVMSLPADATPVSIEFFESERTGVRFAGADQVLAAAAVGADVIAGMTELSA